MARAALLVLLLLAGCAAPPEDGAAPAAAAPAFFDAPSCDEGGGYVVWNPDGLYDERAGTLPAPFEVADVTDDLGAPPVTAFGEASRRPLAGAYHVVVTCPTWTLDGV